MHHAGILLDRRAVHAAWVRVSGLIPEAGLTAAPRQSFPVKLEIDTRPPEGAHLLRSIINRHMLFAIQYHDFPFGPISRIRWPETPSKEPARSR